MRKDRANNQIRSIKFIPDYVDSASGSCLVELGKTKIICTAVIEDKVPPFLKGSGTGWLACEYSMLPASTQKRKIRDIAKLKLDGRSAEIQRLIGRSLRSCVDLRKLGERTVWIDCDVINADGGTRTAAINGGFIALAIALSKLYDTHKISNYPILSLVAAISVGIVNGENLVDLEYIEDSNADVDMNLVIDEKENVVELQLSSEKKAVPFSELNTLTDLARCACKTIFDIEIECLKEVISENAYNCIIN